LWRARISHPIWARPLLSFSHLIPPHSPTQSCQSLREEKGTLARSTLPSKQKFNPHLE
jgi:hypothetical protein